MNIGGASIYDEGVGINDSAKEKIRQIVTELKALSQNSYVGMRFVRSGKIVEGLLWGKVKEVPIGVYNRGPSLIAVLNTVQKKVRKECLKIRNANVMQFRPRSNSYKHLPLEMAG